MVLFKSNWIVCLVSRAIFGNKGEHVVKRLNDSDDEGDEPIKKKLAALTSADKPTDILAQVFNITLF